MSAIRGNTRSSTETRRALLALLRQIETLPGGATSKVRGNTRSPTETRRALLALKKQVNTL